MLTRFVAVETIDEAVTQELQSRDEAFKQIRYHLRRAQEQMVKFTNKRCRPSMIKARDWVYLKIRPHAHQITPKIVSQVL